LASSSSAWFLAGSLEYLPPLCLACNKVFGYAQTQDNGSYDI
jgi:hypothetical protein